MLMHVRIRENVYILSDFKVDWCESPISKENFCKLYKLNKDACDFYGDTGELITDDILDCEQVTVLQRPTGVTGLVIGLAAASLVTSVVVTAYTVSKSREMQRKAEELAKRQKSSAAVYSYSLRGSTNDQRNNCPIPIVLGKVNATGDKAGLQYSTYSTDNFQDVHQILCLGYSGKDYNENAEVVPVTVETGDPNTPTLPVGGVIFDTDSKYVTPNPNQKEAKANPDGYVVRIADSPVDTFAGMFVAAHMGQDPLGTENRPSYYTERAIEISTMMELKGDPATRHINPKTQQLDPKMDFEQFSQTSPHNTTDIYVGVYAPYGYYYTDDDGVKQPASYSYTVQWRVAGSDSWDANNKITRQGSMNKAMHRDMVHIPLTFDPESDNQYEVRVFRNDYENYFTFDDASSQWRLADSVNCITLSCEVIKFITRAANNNITGPAGNKKYRHTWPIPYPARYSLLTMKARATDRTNGWLDQVFTEVHLKCRTYVDTPENRALPCAPTMWTIPNDADTNIGTMNNPASVLLYVLTCPQINPHPVKYNQIDWESFRSWWWFCAGRDPNTGEIIYGEDGEPVRNWACNAFITSTMTVAELCELICATGRAHLVMSDNKYSIYIENKTNVITQIFTPRNAWNMMETKSFDDPVTLIKTSFVDKDTEVEENRLTYFQLNPETGKVDIEDGKATILFDNAEEVLLQEDIYKSESMDIWGVTRAKQVAQLTAYNLYKEYFLRRHYTWECGIESLSCTVGDVVYLANDIFMAALGYGRIKDVKVENNQIVGVYLDESIEIHGNQTYGITIRTGAGDFVQKALFVAKNTGALTQYENHMLVPTKGLPEDETEPVITNYLEFEHALPPNIDVMEGNLFIYQDAEKPGRKVLIESIKPNGDRGATITAVDYMEHLYDVDVSTEIPQFVSNINKYGTGANIGTGHNNWEGTNESAPNRLVRAAQQYYISESKDELIGGTWLDSMPEDYNGYVWTRVKYTYTNGETNYTNPTYNLKESDVDTSFATVPHYLVTSQSTGVTKDTQGWTTTVQSMTATNKYLWYYETIIFSTGEGSDSDCFIVGVYGDKGDTGAKGDGVTVSSIEYGASASESTTPSSWSQSVPQLSKGTWLWIKTTYSDNTSSTAKSYIGTDGDDGNSVYVQSVTKVGKATTVVLVDDDGMTSTLTINDGDDGQDGHDGQDGLNGYVHIAWANSADGSVDFSTSVSTNKKYIGSYTDNTQADSQTYSDYSWALIKGDKGDTGATGATGVSITATTDLYAVNNSSSTAPSSGWDTFDNVKGQLSSSNQYLWNKEIVTYSTGNTSELTPHLIYRLSIDGQNGQDGKDGVDGQDGQDGQNGQDGIGISGIEEGYSYGTASASSGNWGSNPLIPSSTTGQNYVWQRERVVFDTSPATYGSWSMPHMIAMWIKGDAGTSVTITSTSVKYQSSNSGTEIPSGTWSDSVPATAGGNFLWTKTEVNYSDGAKTTSYSVSYFAINGANALLFSINPKRQTFIANKRLSASATYEFVILLQGYTGAFSMPTAVGDSSGSLAITLSSGVYQFALPYNNSDSTITISCTHPQAGTVQIYLSCIDKTEYGHYYGLLDTAPTSSSSPAPLYVAGKETDWYVNSTNGETYEYTSTGWQPARDARKLLQGLEALKTSGADLSQYTDKNTVTFLRSIITDAVYATAIKAVEGFFDSIHVTGNALLEGHITNDGITTFEGAGSRSYNGTFTPTNLTLTKKDNGVTYYTYGLDRSYVLFLFGTTSFTQNRFTGTVVIDGTTYTGTGSDPLYITYVYDPNYPALEIRKRNPNNTAVFLTWAWSQNISVRDTFEIDTTALTGSVITPSSTGKRGYITSIDVVSIESKGGFYSHDILPKDSTSDVVGNVDFPFYKGWFTNMVINNELSVGGNLNCSTIYPMSIGNANARFHCYPSYVYAQALYASNGILKLSNLPTSATGLASGRVWNDNGTLKIV